MRLLAALALALLSGAASAEISVQDDGGRTVALAQPARRIVSLAPHATELLFEAGAGAAIVGVSEYSDYPAAAKKIASVGNIFALDLERLLALKPDLVVVWGTGNARQLVEKLRSNHVTVFESEPRNYEMVASSITRLATLAGTETAGQAAAARFRARLETLRSAYRTKSAPVSVFYQVWNKPLMTLNDEHMVSAAIRLCGGKNIFGKLKEISPSVTAEAVLAANPDAIITGGEDTGALAGWRQYASLSAVKQNHLYAVKSDWLNRAGPRILDGTEALCKHLADARNK
ncbi:MAG: cobalamin-binding protein [Burkholderiales bacterium]|nr:cobalamin-binding protein [Burkholderiales bacterium]